MASSPLRSPMTKPAKKFPTGTIPHHQQQQLNFVKLGAASPGNRTADSANCVVCKRPAANNSVYCSEECIRKYAQNAIHAVGRPDSPMTHNASVQSPLNHSLEAKKNKKKDLFEDMLRQADSVSKVDRVRFINRID